MVAYSLRFRLFNLLFARFIIRRPLGILPRLTSLNLPVKGIEVGIRISP